MKEGNVVEPVFRLRDEFQPESYVPAEYVGDAIVALDVFGWLHCQPTAQDVAAAVEVLQGLDDLTLDVTDVFPFGLLWVLYVRGATGHVPGLREQLVRWRAWEEAEHIGEPLAFLPPMPAVPTWEERNRDFTHIAYMPGGVIGDV